MRILLASDHYPPFIGGAHRQVHILATSLADRGHVVDVATVWNKAPPTAGDSFRVHRIRQLRTAAPTRLLGAGQRHQPPYPDPVSIVQLRRLIARCRPDVVHSYGWISFACAAALVGTDTPLIISARDYAYSCATRTLLHEGGVCSGPSLGKCVVCAGDYYGRSRGLLAACGVYLSRPVLRRKVSAVHSISRYVQEIVRRDFAPSGYRHDPILELVLPSFGPDIELWPSEDISPFLVQLPEQPYILFVGAFRRAKGLEVLFDAYSRLDDPPPLVLIGTHERDSPPIPHGVLALERFPHRAVMAAWDRALFGVFPSLWPEPLGNVVYEAMSRGRAVIGTTPGGQTDMITNGESGILVPSGDAAALTDAMARLLADRALCRKYGAAGRQRSRQFDRDRVMPMLEQAYEFVVAGNVVRPG